ncbi:hypothetical protein Hdeb2414_s0025g00662851 [Helianthus debilis subsp. tardiflorus]
MIFIRIWCLVRFTPKKRRRSLEPNKNHQWVEYDFHLRIYS